MAHFYGKVQGQRGQASRLGNKVSGLSTVAASWEGAVEVEIRYNRETDTDVVSVTLIPWHGKGTRRVLYDGPISGNHPAGACEPHCGSSACGGN